jgi:hypothetical protein
MTRKYLLIVRTDGIPILTYSYGVIADLPAHEMHAEAYEQLAARLIAEARALRAAKAA